MIKVYHYSFRFPLDRNKISGLAKPGKRNELEPDEIIVGPLSYIPS